jgi:hypothetical protein
MDSDSVTISLYSTAVPRFVDGVLNQLYQCMHSSFAYHSIYGNITQDTCTYVARKNGEVVAALLFSIEDGMARVLNEQLSLDADEIDRFSDYIFKEYPSVHIVWFPVIENKIGSLLFPYQQSPCTQDIVLTLPETADAYLNSLGKATRSYIKRYLNKLKRSFPTMSCKTYGNNEVSEQHVRDIIALNRARMASRCQSSSIDEAETERIIRLVRLCGMVTMVTIDGRVCAGAINYRFGDNYFLSVISHDPEYDEFGLGTLCCYLGICECIARHGREYHFLWGRYDYKYRLLGVQRDLSRLAIYRSRLQLFLNSRRALKLACEGYAYQARDWMESKMRRLDNASVRGRLAFHGLNGLKKLKRSVSRLRANRNNAIGESVSLHKESSHGKG